MCIDDRVNIESRWNKAGAPINAWGLSQNPSEGPLQGRQHCPWATYNYFVDSFLSSFLQTVPESSIVAKTIRKTSAGLHGPWRQFEDLIEVLARLFKSLSEDRCNPVCGRHWSWPDSHAASSLPNRPLISFEGTLVSVRGLGKIVAGPLKGFAHNIKGLWGRSKSYSRSSQSFLNFCLKPS